MPCPVSFPTHFFNQGFQTCQVEHDQSIPFPPDDVAAGEFIEDAGHGFPGRADATRNVAVNGDRPQHYFSRVTPAGGPGLGRSSSA